jgi:hypothetical protein
MNISLDGFDTSTNPEVVCPCNVLPGRPAFIKQTTQWISRLSFAAAFMRTFPVLDAVAFAGLSIGDNAVGQGTMKNHADEGEEGHPFCNSWNL